MNFKSSKTSVGPLKDPAVANQTLLPPNEPPPVLSADRYRAPALDKGLDILELLAEQAQGMTRAEIVKALHRSPSEVYRMLERLVARRYVARSYEGDRYALSLKLFVLGHRHPPMQRLIAQARPVMDAFTQATEQSCHLGVYDQGNITVLTQSSGPGNWGLSIRVGVRVSLIDTGSGHVLLAYQSASRRAEMLAEHEALDGECTIPADNLQTLLDDVRQLGYWEGPSQQAQGVTDISVPVLSSDGQALAVMTCPHIRRIDRHVSPDVEQVRALLLRGAAELTLN